ncbi:isochorismate synthase [uncultured Bacteroides sp.]|uniref:isochorismate synthase n=1 Tax=uncultured Bacteroides sp. TaxID=162156 RepID=UPI002614AA87|nr:isochorismate synthase [uncultured Bacteroides sp.]
MNKPDSHIHKLIDRMTCSNTSFAIYRLPWTDIPLLVMQDGGEPQTFSSLKELNGQKGFVISPFSFTSSHPGVIIRPDITASGWEEISEKISSITISDTEQECTSTAIDIKPETELKERYMEVFANFISPLKSKKIGKLVLSRNASYKLDESFSPLEAFVTACNSYPRMMISLSHTPVSGTWIGSTPEIILSGEGDTWNTVALAGTMPMQGEVMPTEWHKKEKDEQAFVSEYISKVIKKFSSKIAVKGPYTARAGQLVHLRTDFQFGLKKTSELGNLLDALHPTPAVCGMPKDKAYDFIIENEGYDRKYYSGIIGWLNPEGHTTLYVNLRCLNIDGNYATLYAGGGILPSSDANSEWEETQHKMKTIKLVISC